MHPRRNEYDGLVAPESGDFLVAEGQPFGHLMSLPALLGRNDEQIDNPPLIALGEFALLEEEFIILLVVRLQIEDVLAALVVGIGVDEGELDTADQLIEGEVEF